MQREAGRSRWLPWLILLGVAAVFLLRHLLLALLSQLLAGYALMALALPVCRLLEKKLPPSLAASLSFLVLTLAAAALLTLLIPPIARQFRQFSDALPSLIAWGQKLLSQAQAFLQTHGMNASPVRDGLFTQLSQAAGGAVATLAKSAGQAAQAAGKLFLAPLFAFYLLRDRRRIASFLALVIPVQHRARVVRAAREMRRETVNFLRGQLLVSAAVGALTALGLLLTRTPAWLLLGLLMGVLELIPYAGPMIAGTLAVLMALQGGIIRALWTLGILIAVQQLDGGLLSPRLLSGATRLHPLIVLMAISAGGMLAGASGMLLALPVVVSFRGAVRGLRA